MGNKKLRFKTTAALLLVGAFLLFCGSLAYAADRCQIIRVEETKGAGRRIDIFPSKITIPVGTCTVWINSMREGDVQVSFREDAKQCMLSTEAPTGFKEVELKPGETCYVSETLVRGKTASLVWNKPGVFKYTLAYVGFSAGQGGAIGDPTAEGVIEVK